MAQKSPTWIGGVALVAFATCCVLVVHFSPSDSQIRLFPKFSCTDSSICSKYALLRASPADGNGAERIRGPGSSMPLHRTSWSGDLINAPLVATTNFVQSKILQASGNSTARDKKMSGLILQPGDVVHLSTEQGALPLIVDGRPDHSGNIPVHAFREGLRYDGFIRMGRKGTETHFPPSSLLHAGQRGRDHGRIERIRGRLEGESSDQQVRGELALERMISRPQDKEQARHTYSRAQKAALHTPPAAPPPKSQVSHQTEAVGQTGAHQKKLNSVQRRSDGSHTVTVKKASVIKGYFDMSNDHFASVNLKPTACSGAAMSPSCGTSSFACSAHLHLHVEVFCPPYKAPEHGSVTYRGKEYRDHTGSEASGRQYLTINGHRYPLAASGDIPSCEQVKIHCDPHYELDGREGAFRDPYCLQSGEWEEGQSCVRIKCKPYRPPVNGYVFPTGEVFAGDSVAIKCDPGFMPHFGEEGAKENPACLDTRAYEPGVSCVPIMCPAYRAPQHASVTPTGPVRVGERVSIVCDSGYRARIYNDLHPTLWPTFGVETGSMPDDLVGTATPLCLETSKYEEGITCVPLPVQCPAYRAPNHGSVWYNLDEYRIASPSGLEGWPRTDSLFITCDEHYQLSDEGRQSIRCLRTGEWEQGKTCDPIMCDSFQAPPHSSFSGPRTRVLAGTQVFVSCNEGYKASGFSRGLTASPKCLDSGYFEVPIQCVPLPKEEEPAESRSREERVQNEPQPRREAPSPPARHRPGIEQPEASPRSPREHSPPPPPPPPLPPLPPTKPLWLQEEEQGKDAGYTVHDYSPNIFDQEPRPFSYGS